MRQTLKAYHSEWCDDDLRKARGAGITIDSGNVFRCSLANGHDDLGAFDEWTRPISIKQGATRVVDEVFERDQESWHERLRLCGSSAGADAAFEEGIAYLAEFCIIHGVTVRELMGIE